MRFTEMGFIDNIFTTLEISRKKKEAAHTNYTNRNVFVMPNVNKEQLKLIKYDRKNIDNDIYRYDTKSESPALDFIWGESKSVENIIISGGTADERSRAILPFICKNQQTGIPIIILHIGDQILSDAIKDYCVSLEEITKNGVYYDVFRMMSSEDIAFLLYESIPKEISNPKMELLLRAIVEVLLRSESKVTFQNLANFPIANFMDKLNQGRGRGNR